MQNKCIIDENGNEQWISRSVVVASVVLRFTKNNKVEALVEKRGPAVSATGKWCFPCGYLDYDETITEGVIREVREETGYVLKKHNIEFIDINSKPDGKKQNVVIRHISFLEETDKQIDNFELDTNEVTELKWVEIGTYHQGLFINRFDIDFNNLDGVGKWAFKHKGELIHILDEYCQKYGINLEIKNRK